MSAGEEGDQQPGPDEEFRIAGEKLSEFFEPKKGHKPVTRRQLQTILSLFASKADVNEGMNVLAFQIRRSLRQMIEEERVEHHGPESDPRRTIVLPEDFK